MLFTDHLHARELCEIMICVFKIKNLSFKAKNVTCRQSSYRQ